VSGAASLEARAAPARPKVEVDVSHRYGALVVHEELRFSVMENEFLCVSGPSGCGKTTLLDILAGILRPSEGRVLIDGRPVDPKRDRISFVFQEPSTLPWLNVWDNVATGLRIKKVAPPVVRRKVDEIIEIVGLRDYETYYPHQISGGMKQRVAIARAFAIDADLILMDEPFVSLDQPTRERMQREVLHTWEHRRRTVVFVTHNLEEAVFLGDRVVVLSAKPARIVAEIDVPLARPRNPLSHEFTRIRATCAEIMQSLDARRPRNDKVPRVGS
jgi:ABC-type nitrate/sulfonate/bicarbonate transport system ATPase subunit